MTSLCSVMLLVGDKCFSLNIITLASFAFMLLKCINASKYVKHESCVILLSVRKCH